MLHHGLVLQSGGQSSELKEIPLTFVVEFRLSRASRIRGVMQNSFFFFLFRYFRRALLPARRSKIAERRRKSKSAAFVLWISRKRRKGNVATDVFPAINGMRICEFANDRGIEELERRVIIKITYPIVQSEYIRKSRREYINVLYARVPAYRSVHCNRFSYYCKYRNCQITNNNAIN